MTFGLAFTGVTLPALFYVHQHSYEEDAFNHVLRLSARIAILVYLAIFVARPLRQLTGSAFSKFMLTNRRQIGVAFAAIMAAHLLYLMWKNGFVFPILGAAIYALILLLLITSFDGPTRALGPARWRLLHKTGLYAIGIALAQAQFGRIIRGVGEPVHYVLAFLFIAAIAVRTLAWNQRRVSKN